MTLAREKKQKQSLRVTIPSISQSNYGQRLQSLSSSPSSSSSSSSTSPGIENLANFDKLAILGHGNGGTVYKVCHRPTNEIYALKVLRIMEESERVQQRVLTEVEILRRVDSGFVVMCHGVFENGFSGADGIEDICFLLEYMEGGSLHDLLQKHPMLSENAISGIARSVLEGLHYLHSMQIVHSDIKPSNLLINRKGEVKIADFGVSQCIAGVDKEQCQSYLGTSAYMSPERIDPDGWDGMHSDGFAGDVWSLGVVVMECFIGHFPLIKQRDWRIRGTVEELLVHPFVAKYEDSAAEHLLYYASIM